MVFGFCPGTKLTGEVMIIWVSVDFKGLMAAGKKYSWKRPRSCPGCGGAVWGHGYVWRYFAEAMAGCRIKRYRCPNCKKVITMRPLGYWPRYCHRRETIYASLEGRLKSKRWPKELKRQVCGHWLRCLKRQVKKMFGLVMKIIPEGFEALVEAWKVPVSRSKKGAMIPQLC